MLIVADSDGLIGFLSNTDAHHTKSLQIMERLIEQEAQIIYPVTTICESATILQARLKKKNLSKLILDLLLSDKLMIIPVDEKLLKQAASLLNPVKQSSHHTLFDAIVVALAKKTKADGVFSYDSFYKKNGLKLAEDLIA